MLMLCVLCGYLVGVRPEQHAPGEDGDGGCHREAELDVVTRIVPTTHKHTQAQTGTDSKGLG
jgi:hypothetical protein